jgi:hypothetical protein
VREKNVFGPVYNLRQTLGASIGLAPQARLMGATR